MGTHVVWAPFRKFWVAPKREKIDLGGPLGPKNPILRGIAAWRPESCARFARARPLRFEGRAGPLTVENSINNTLKNYDGTKNFRITLKLGFCVLRTLFEFLAFSKKFGAKNSKKR